MAMTSGMRAAFRRDGFLVVPEVLSGDQVATGRAVVAGMLERQPFADDHVGPYFLWPRFSAVGHPLLDLYRNVGVAALAAQLLRPDLMVQEPDGAQLAVTIPPGRIGQAALMWTVLPTASPTVDRVPSRCWPACG